MLRMIVMTLSLTFCVALTACDESANTNNAGQNATGRRPVPTQQYERPGADVKTETQEQAGGPGAPGTPGAPGGQ